MQLEPHKKPLPKPQDEQWIKRKRRIKPDYWLVKKPQKLTAQTLRANSEEARANVKTQESK